MENYMEKSKFSDEKLPTIAEFFKGKVIFITGGTGEISMNYFFSLIFFVNLFKVNIFKKVT